MNIQRIARLLQDKEQVIRETVLDTSQRKGAILYGSRAYNMQVPSHLRKKTTDYDILTKKPKKSAQEVAEVLRRRLGKTVDVVKGSHKGTYRVKIDNEVVADYTQLKKKPKTKKIWGIEARDIKSIKKSTQRLVKNPKAEYRKEKDLNTLERINELERLERRFS